MSNGRNLRRVLFYLVAVTAFSAHPGFVHGSELTPAAANPVLVYAEQYSAQTGRLDPIDFVAAPDAGKGLKPVSYREILGMFQRHLEARGTIAHFTQDKQQADYQLIFVDIPYLYTENDDPRQIEPPSGHRGFPPPLPVNKHASAAIDTRELTSPWLHATLYTDHAKAIVGGVIVVPVVQYLRIKELDHAARGEWDALAATPTNSKRLASWEPQIVWDTLRLYESTFLGTGEKRPDENRLRAVFGKGGEQAILAARVAAISFQSTFAPFVGNWRDTINQCLDYSTPFYLKLYELLLTSTLVTPSAAAMTHNQHYSFIPSTQMLQELATKAGDYNCFINPPYKRKEARP